MLGKARFERIQVNLVFSPESPLAKRLVEAESKVGQPRTQIARSVINEFLETWLQAEVTKIDILQAARDRSASAALRAPHRDLTGDADNASSSLRAQTRIATRKEPRDTGDDNPEPGYHKVVETRQRMPRQIAKDTRPLKIIGRVQQQPRSTTMEIMDDDVDER